MARYFPLFTDINNCHVLIVGGGKTAYDKIQKLLFYGPQITVAAREFSPKIISIRGIHIRNTDERQIEKLILDILPKAVIVTDTSLVNTASVYETCVKNRIEINTVDRRDLCTFIFPSMINKGRLTVAVSTSGASPAAAVKIREAAEKVIPTEVDAILDWLASLRPVLRCRKDIDEKKLGELYRALTDTAFEKNRPLDTDETEAIIEYIKCQ